MFIWNAFIAFPIQEITADTEHISNLGQSCMYRIETNYKMLFIFFQGQKQMKQLHGKGLTWTLTLPCSFSCNLIISTSAEEQSCLSSATFLLISSMATSIGFKSVWCWYITGMRFFTYGKQCIAVERNKFNTVRKRFFKLILMYLAAQFNNLQN